MEKITAVPVEVQLDVEDIKAGIMEITGLADTVREIGANIRAMFDSASRGIDSLVVSVERLAAGLDEATVAMGTLTESISSQSGSDTIFNSISTAISALSLACDLESAKWVGSIGSVVKPAGNAIAVVGKKISKAIGMIGGGKIALIAAAIAVVIAAIVSVVKHWDGIKAFFAKVGEWFNTNVIQPVAKIFTELWAGIVSTARQAWDGIVAVFSSFGSWVNTNVIQPVVGFFVGLWTSVTGVGRIGWFQSTCYAKRKRWSKRRNFQANI